jgi:hypothetical protein
MWQFSDVALAWKKPAPKQYTKDANASMLMNSLKKRYSLV